MGNLYHTDGSRTASEASFRKANDIFARIIEEFPQSDASVRAWYYSAHCMKCVGEYAAAIERFSKVVVEWPDYEEACIAYFLIARCYEQLARQGAMTEAAAAPHICQACEKIVSRYPGCRTMKAATVYLEDWGRKLEPEGVTK